MRSQLEAPCSCPAGNTACKSFKVGEENNPDKPTGPGNEPFPDGNLQNWGNAVRIRHAGGFTSWYFHIQTKSVLVNVGDVVVQGQAIAISGDRSATLNWMRSEIEQAVLLMQRGDDEALEQALALLQNTVFSFSMRVCGQRQDAEDTMQEVLLKSVPHPAQI